MGFQLAIFPDYWLVNLAIHLRAFSIAAAGPNRRSSVSNPSDDWHLPHPCPYFAEHKHGFCLTGQYPGLPVPDRAISQSLLRHHGQRL